ncbi:MAG: thioredoxin domain-containing protein [Anaerolineae bacterium]
MKTSMKFWQKVLLLGAVVLLLTGCWPVPWLSKRIVTPLATPAPAERSFTLIEVLPPDGELVDVLRTRAHQAFAAQRPPYVYVYADWCAPCRSLRASLDNLLMQDALANTTIIQVNYDMWQASLEQAGFHIAAIPLIAEINRAGQPTGRFITGSAWGEDIPQNMAPPLKQFFQGNLNNQSHASG